MKRILAPQWSHPEGARPEIPVQNSPCARQFARNSSTVPRGSARARRPEAEAPPGSTVPPRRRPPPRVPSRRSGQVRGGEGRESQSRGEAEFSGSSWWRTLWRLAAPRGSAHTRGPVNIWQYHPLLCTPAFGFLISARATCALLMSITLPSTTGERGDGDKSLADGTCTP